MAVKNAKPQTEEEARAAEMQSGASPATDDPAPGQDVAPPSGDDPAAPSAEAAEAAPENVETPRQRLAKRFNQKRREELAGQPDTTIYAEAEREQAEASARAAPEPQPAPVAAKPTPAQPAGDEPIIKIKVDGRELELPQSEVVRLAQTNVAFEARQRELDRINTELRQKRAELKNPAAPDANTDGARPQLQPGKDTAPSTPTKLDKARLREIAERIQTGDGEDAVTALEELVTSIVPAQPDVDVDARVNAAMARQHEQVAVNEAVNDFATKFPTIAEDRDLERMAYNRTLDVMLDELEKAGVEPQKLAVLAKAPVGDIVRTHQSFHRYVAKDGSKPFVGKVRHYSEVLESAGQYVVEKFNGGSPKPPTAEPRPAPLSDRTERKQSLTPQPKATNARAEAPADTPPGGKPDHRSAVQKLAALRNKGRAAIA